eukprot:scaffold5232_cov73-Phaeocystis_antarctica.AAC.6
MGCAPRRPVPPRPVPRRACLLRMRENPHARTHARTHARMLHRARHPPSQSPPPQYYVLPTVAVQPTPPVACSVGRSQVETKRLQAQLAQLVSSDRWGARAFFSRARL